jgi:hypothetical protein
MTILSDRYNGWSNYATWRVNLEMIDGLDPRDMGWHKLDKYDLATALKEWATEMLESEIETKHGNSLVMSYAMAFVSDVNWYEIGKYVMESYADQCEDESEESDA